MFRLNAFHFLAKVASSEALIEYNDTKEVDENIDMLENDIEQLSIDELSQAGERMQSGDTVYAAFMKEDIDSLLASLDLSNSHNYVNAFITLAEDQNESEMYSMAEGYSEKLEKHPLHKLDALKETVCPILPLLQRTNGHLYEGHCNIEQMQPKHKYKYWTCFKRFMWMTAPLFPICSQKQKPNMTSVRHSSIKSNML